VLPLKPAVWTMTRYEYCLMILFENGHILESSTRILAAAHPSATPPGEGGVS